MEFDFRLPLAQGSHLISFTKTGDPNHANYPEGGRNDVLESRFNKDFELGSTTDLVTSLETEQRSRSNGAASHNAYENMKEALKNVLARRSEIKNDTLSLSVRYSYHPAVPPAEGSSKAEIALSGPFLHSIFAEYKGPLMIYLWFTVCEQAHRVNLPHPEAIWFFSSDLVPSINQQGEYVFVESISSQVRESKRVQEGVEYRGCFTIQLCAPRKPITSELFIDRVDVNAKILANEIQWDFELIAKTGKRFRCHKTFLAANSPVLCRMLESNCEEMRGNAYQLDLCEAGVEDLISFMYQANTRKPMRDSLTLWEMFEVGLKYEVVDLVEAIKAKFLRQTNEWIEVDVAVKLFLYTLTGDGNGQLKWKVIQAMKSKSNELMSSAAFGELWKNEPDTAKEIMRLVLMVNVG